MTEEIGLKQPVEYTEEEKRTIATHEAGPRDRRLPRRARTASSRCSRSSSARTRSACSPTPTPRSASPAPAPRSIALDPDRLRRHGGRGAVLRRVGHRPGGDLAGGDASRRRRWSARSAWPARSCRFEAIEAGAGHARASSPRCSPTTTRAPAVERILDQAKADVRTLLDDEPAPRRARCATRCSSATSSSATRSSTCSARSRGRARSADEPTA